MFIKVRYVLLSIVVFAVLNSCKKSSEKPDTSVTIVGKWFITKQIAVLSYNGVQLDAKTKTNFTSDDFIEFYNDGSGYYSYATSYFSNHPGFTEFTYVLKGANLTQYTSISNDGIPETITSLTANGLSIHVVSSVADPNDPSVTDTEIDDVTYIK